MSRILLHVRRTLVAGTLAAFPLIVTYWVVRWLFGILDGLFAPVVDRAIGFHIPGVGLLISLAVFYVFGMISANVLGRQIQGAFDHLFSRLPVLRTVYTSAKQVVDTFSMRQRRERQAVVLVEFPAKGHFMVGFVTKEYASSAIHPDGTVAVFVPTSPNPTSGALLFLPGSAVVPTGMTAEEAFKIVLSGGVLLPDSLGIDPAINPPGPSAPARP